MQNITVWFLYCSVNSDTAVGLLCTKQILCFIINCIFINCISFVVAYALYFLCFMGSVCTTYVAVWST